MQPTPMILGRLSDGGPVYTETNLSNLVAEPFNALTALPFLILAIYWLVQLRGSYRENRFLVANLVVLAVGGIGGTLYHAFRSSHLFFLMDVMPIVGIAFVLSIYFWIYVLPKRWMVLPAVAPFFVAQRAMFFWVPSKIAVNLSYMLLASCIIVPMVLALRKDHWRNAGLVAASVGLFVVAIFFRAADSGSGPWIGIGTHWLWHTFSAASVACLASYLVRFTSTRRLQ